MLIKIKLSYEVGKKMNGDAMFLVIVRVFLCSVCVCVRVVCNVYLWVECVRASEYFFRCLVLLFDFGLFLYYFKSELDNNGL